MTILEMGIFFILYLSVLWYINQVKCNNLLQSRSTYAAVRHLLIQTLVHVYSPSSLVAVELKYQALLSCIVCRVRETQVCSIENWKAEERRNMAVSARKNGAWLACLSRLIYISGEERDRVCNQRVAPPGSKSSSPPVDCAICVVARQRGTDRRPSSRVEDVSRWQFNYALRI